MLVFLTWAWACTNFENLDPDGEQGFPGEVISYVTYTLTNLTWSFKMIAVATTKKTPIMLSSHVRYLSKPLISPLPFSTNV